MQAVFNGRLSSFTRQCARASRRFSTTVEKKSSEAITTPPPTSPSATAAEKAGSDSSVPIGATLAAAVAASAFVSMAAAAVEVSTADDVPIFDPKGQRFSQGDFQGRFARMLLACDPRLLFYSSSQVEQAKSLVNNAEKYRDDRSMDRTLWEARRVVEAALHPDTGDVIPHPFRMSGYVPGNGRYCVSCVSKAIPVSCIHDIPEVLTLDFPCVIISRSNLRCHGVFDIDTHSSILVLGEPISKCSCQLLCKC